MRRCGRWGRAEGLLFVEFGSIARIIKIYMRVAREALGRIGDLLGREVAAMAEGLAALRATPPRDLGS